MPNVSVVIPTYNRSNLVREAIESVLRQSYTDVEVLVVDDGSTDDTHSIVQQIPDSRIKYYYKENGGPSSARNLGLFKSKGLYISFMDSDDLWPPKYLETMTDQLEANKDFGAAYSRVICIQQDGTEKDMSADGRYFSGWMAKAFFQSAPSLFPSAICFRTSVWKDIFWDEQLIGGEDYDLFVRISGKTNFLFVPDAFVIKRWQPDNLTSTLPNPTGIVNGARTLERFYLHLGGDRFVPRRLAKRKISHRYRKASKLFCNSGSRRAALLLVMKAICFCPVDLRLYLDLARAFILSKKNDNLPNWQMPELLPPVRSSNHDISDC